MSNNWKLAKELKVGHPCTGGLLTPISTGIVLGLQGVLGEQLCQVATWTTTCTINSSGCHLWSTYHVLDTGLMLCTLHLMEPSWPPSKGGCRDLEEIGSRLRSQLVNHRAGARGQVGLLPNPVFLPLCQAPASIARRKLLGHLVQPPCFSDGVTDS